MKEKNADEIQMLLKKLSSGQDFEIEMFVENSIELISHFLEQKIKADMSQLLPRALVFCSSIDVCEKIEQRINTLANDRDLKVVIIHDKANSVKQRNTLYEGVDIVVGNPKRITELYYQNGINLKQIQHFIITESNQIAKSNHLPHLKRLIESTKKCQKIVFVESKNEKIDLFIEENLTSPILHKLIIEN
jgi:superfamily II DNA/RNA helicase